MLEEVELSETVTELSVAGKPWLGPHEFLFKAKLAQRPLPILWWLPGGGSGGSVYWSILTKIELERDATRLFFDGFEARHRPARPPSG